MIARSVLLALSLVSSSSQATEFVNMTKILANGERYDGRVVQFSGYVCERTDSREGIFLTKDDCEAANYDNGVRMNRNGFELPCAGLVRVQGSFKFNDQVVGTDDPYSWGELELLYVY